MPGLEQTEGDSVSLRPGSRSLPAAAATAAGRLPRVVEPMMPAVAPEPFDSPAHIFEVIWDGLRAIVFVEGDEVRVQDRFGRDVTHRFPELGAIAGRVKAAALAFDGVIVALDRDGRPDLGRLAPRLAVDDPALAVAMADDTPATFEAFDLLYREGQHDAIYAVLTDFQLRARPILVEDVFAGP